MPIEIEIQFRVIDHGEGGLVEETSLTQRLTVTRRGRRWLAVESGSESGPVGVGYSCLMAIHDYLKNRTLAEE